MKNIYQSLTVCLILVLSVPIMQSCLKDQEDVFPESASARMTNYLDNVSKALLDTDNGWVLNYYPDRQQSYGGTVYTLKFDEQNVAVKTQLDNGEETYTSTYKLTSDAGPVLSFDTYNQALHIYATPSFQRYEAYDGDFEFIILGVSDDRNTITLKGKRTGNMMYMHRLTTTPEAYLASIQEVSAGMYFQTYGLTINGTEVSVDNLDGNLTMTYLENGREQTVYAPYIFTPQGMEFYQPISILGKELTGVRYVPKSGEPAIGDSFPAFNDESVRFVAVLTPLNILLTRGSWYAAYSSLGTWTRPYWNYVNSQLAGYGEQLHYAYLGNENGGYGLQFACTDGSQDFVSTLYLNYTLTEKDKISLAFAFSGAGEAVWYYNNTGFAYIIHTFGHDEARNFTLTTDNPEKPTYITLTENENPANVITLWANPVYYPFNN